MGLFSAIAGGAIGAIGSILGGRSAASGAESAGQASLQGTRESIAAQERMFAESMRYAEQARQDSLAGWYAQQYYSQPQRQAQYWGMEGLMRELYGSDFNAQFPSYEAQHLSAFYDPTQAQAQQRQPTGSSFTLGNQMPSPEGWAQVGRGGRYSVPMPPGMPKDLAQRAWQASQDLNWGINDNPDEAYPSLDRDRFLEEYGRVMGREFDPYEYRRMTEDALKDYPGASTTYAGVILGDRASEGDASAPVPRMPRAVDDIDQYPGSDYRARPMGGGALEPGSYMSRPGWGGVTGDQQQMPEYQNAPALNIQGSPLYQWQREQGEEAINRQLSARHLLNSGYGMGTLADYYQRLDANEAMRIQNLMQTMAGYSPSTPSFSGSYTPASLAQAAGGQMANTYMQGGQLQANALLQAGQARSDMWTNLANLGMAGANAYTQYLGGLDSHYGGGGGSYLNPSNYQIGPAYRF